ncbi:hypothetical protein CHS0354_020509 [Potamilus streckersoni]|uniref:Uncharacterized protein n=1 Tax=Potamilus streckersoni TaxID=2493646 RepID=A0AAE0W553_9BIVA|nr:hypothetical protein CHS0354_020509 [Potamilus streckersoni]
MGCSIVLRHIRLKTQKTWNRFCPSCRSRVNIEFKSKSLKLRRVGDSKDFQLGLHTTSLLFSHWRSDDIGEQWTST